MAGRKWCVKLEIGIYHINTNYKYTNNTQEHIDIWVLYLSILIIIQYNNIYDLIHDEDIINIYITLFYKHALDTHYASTMLTI